jgi:DNA-nicking Smr family endonuclease
MRFFNCYRLAGLIVSLIMAMTVVACSSQSDKEEAQGVKKEVAETVEAAGKYVDEQRKEAVTALHAAYDDFSGKVEAFKERNAFNFTERKANLVQKIEGKKAAIEAQLQQAGMAAEESWTELKASITAAMEEMEKDMKDFESPK